ncbi:uncharacterized protein [Lolium perenne]|uniref:uncharacterized protein isoform X2 n=1 Tax=Lolium perenne TaxID=4522 RepID=UPI0021F5034C|nr:uncharacterized protein LOC127344012 isoform X2 [Lolium perenne]
MNCSRLAGMAMIPTLRAMRFVVILSWVLSVAHVKHGGSFGFLGVILKYSEFLCAQEPVRKGKTDFHKHPVNKEASSLEGRISNEEGTELLRLAPSFLHYERREWPNVRTLVLALVSVQKDVKGGSKIREAYLIFRLICGC